MPQLDLTLAEQRDVAQLQSVAAAFGAEVAIIGAIALLCFVKMNRYTKDIDLAVAIDLEDFHTFSADLKKLGWAQSAGREHRWRAPEGSVIDVLPAGPRLRAERRIVWPESQFAMSLVGFEHVFTRAVAVSLNETITVNVAPPAVVALLKIVAYIEAPQRRTKDLTDLQALMGSYEEHTGRRYGEEIFDAELEDIEFASAFLLGADIGAIATEEDTEIVHRLFMKTQLSPHDIQEMSPFGLERDLLRFQHQLRAFKKGFDRGRTRIAG